MLSFLFKLLLIFSAFVMAGQLRAEDKRIPVVAEVVSEKYVRQLGIDDAAAEMRFKLKVVEGLSEKVRPFNIFATLNLKSSPKNKKLVLILDRLDKKASVKAFYLISEVFCIRETDENRIIFSGHNFMKIDETCNIFL